MKKTKFKLNPKSLSLTSFSVRVIICSIGLVAILSLIIFILFGLRTNFEQKKATLNGYASLLSTTESMPFSLNDMVSARQQEVLKLLDSTIESVDLYSFEEELILNDPKNDGFLSFLTKSTYAVKHEILIDPNMLDTQKPALNEAIQKMESNSPATAKIKGYIVIQMNLSTLRHQWFKENMLIVFLIGVFYIFIGIGVHRVTNVSRQQAIALKNIANQCIDNPNDINLLQNIQSKNDNSMIFIEYQKIQYGFNTLMKAVIELTKEQDILQETIDNTLQRHEQKFHSHFQKMITSELNKTAHAVSTGVKILRQQYLGEEQQDALSIIRNSSKRFNMILEQLKLLEKIDSGDIEIQNLEFNSLQIFSDIVSEYEALAEKKGLQLLHEVSHHDYMLEGDVNKIKSVLKVLLDNAIKYTPAGNVKIESHMQHLDFSTRWTIKISDTGIGIAKSDWDEIFMPFFQIENNLNSNHEGIGLSLMLAKQLTKLMGGSLSVRSELGRGSDFELVLPMMDKKQVLTKNQLTGVSIAIYQNQDTHDINLSNRGAECHVIYTMDETINYSLNNRIDVLIINEDIEEKQVLETCHQLRQKEVAHRTFVFWLSDKPLTDEMKAQSVGLDGVLQKSSSQEVADTIRKWL